MTSLLRALLFVAAGSLAVTVTTRAQTPEERAKAILQLFEAGQKDSAYQLIEPLKKEARFVPAVIYTRAQMTPDDRALNLYREIIALEPDGAWADKAAHQLVRRYVDKRDSEAAYVWAGVLHRDHATSPYVALADDLLAGVERWEIEMPGPAEQLVADASVRTEPRTTRVDTAAKPPETFLASGMRGYALQVGLFPTRAAAEKHAADLAKKKLKAVPLPKTVNGRKQYALVVGPYASVEAATKKKADVSRICGCQSFIVKVE